MDETLQILGEPNDLASHLDFGQKLKKTGSVNWNLGKGSLYYSQAPTNREHRDLSGIQGRAGGRGEHAPLFGSRLCCLLRGLPTALSLTEKHDGFEQLSAFSKHATW